MKNIETGPDQLTHLVEERGRIEAREAATTLSVNQDVIVEWAEFLQDEGLLNVEYKFNSVYIEPRKLTEEQLTETTKYVSNDKDALRRKIDSSLKLLEKDYDAFDDLQTAFDKHHNAIKEQVNLIEQELSDLSDLKKAKEDIKTTHRELDASLDDAKANAKKQREAIKDQFEDLQGQIKERIEAVDQRGDTLQKHRVELESAQDTLDDAQQRITTLQKELKDTRKELKATEKTHGKLRSKLRSIKDDAEKQSEERLRELRSNTDKVLEDLETKHQDFKELAQQHQEQIENITTDAEDTTHDIHEDLLQIVHLKEELKDIDDAFKATARTLHKLEDEIQSLSVAADSQNIKSELKNIEEQVKNAQNQRATIRERINEFIESIKP